MAMQRSAEGDIVRLRDGRAISFVEYGDPEGFVVVNAHGGLSCRLDVASAGPAATASGIRLISPDRPGVGRSDPQPGRSLLDWAHDVGELVDDLGVDRFGVMGWSMGGQYAAAVGYAMPSRVARVAIIARIFGAIRTASVPNRSNGCSPDDWSLSRHPRTDEGKARCD